jgi:hypothetical protein
VCVHTGDMYLFLQYVLYIVHYTMHVRGCTHVENKTSLVSLRNIFTLEENKRNHQLKGLSHEIEMRFKWDKWIEPNWKMNL